jgi:two-component system response regulator AtoC
LDEIGELDLALQAKLLRALESGEIKRVGSNESQSVKVRIITASHRKLDEEVKRGRFREDLYFRLHVVPLSIPALRLRLSDLPLLVPDLLQKLGIKLRVSEDALRGLQHYDFPGNIRELKNILQRAAVEYEINLSARKENGVLQMDHFRFLEDLKALRLPKTKSEEEEREIMLKLLEECHYNQSEASRRLGVANSTFHDRLKRFGIEIPHPPRRK